MAALPAILVLFLCFNLTPGYVLIGDEENEIVWPSVYHFIAEKLDFATTLKEPVEIWYSAELNRSRIDFYGGATKQFYYGDQGYMITMLPTSNDKLETEIFCLNMSIYEQADFLPDVSELSYTGQTTLLFDKVVDIWTSVEDYDREHELVQYTTLYVYKTEYGVDIPVQREVKVHNERNGDIHSHTVENFFNFKDSVSEEDLTADEDTCSHVEIFGQDFKTDVQGLHPDLSWHVDLAFEGYANHHGKQYKEEEKKMRKNIFAKNWKMIHEHNRKNMGFRMELNEFADKTREELSYLAGTFVSKHEAPETQKFPYAQDEIDDIAKTLPEEYDLRIEGAVTAIKNQGSCGSCWAFATTAAVEGALARANGERLLDLSEQSVVDCAWSFGNYGCHGGLLDTAYKHVLANGIPTEREYGVYTANDGICKVMNMTEVYKIKGFGKVTSQNPSALKIALNQYGPVTVAVYATEKMMYYASGVFYDLTCDSEWPNHAVTVVGYGVRDGEEYWLVKNSWGEAWGEDGYILMSAKNNNCLLLDHCYYPIL